ncbi:hypothetical protein K2X85_03755 [bacterium]|nr:hypothetical protein [bacterium]
MGQTLAVVIGSNSPIGRCLVSRLSQIRVRVLSEPSFSDAAALTASLRGVDVVFHLTSSATSDGRPASDLAHVNHVLMESAYLAEVGCIVHSSPATAMGFTDRADLVRDESSLSRRRMSSSDRLWHDAEEATLEFGNWTGLSVVAVRHAMPITPLSETGSLADNPIRSAMSGVLPRVFDGGLTVAHVQDLADGHVLAWRRGRSGESYILGGQRVEIPSYVRLITDLCPVNRADQAVRSKSARWWPRWKFPVVGSFQDQSPLTWDDLEDQYAWFTCQKGIKELGYHDRSVEESILEVTERMSGNLHRRHAA